jgi:hypothetical protein
MTAATAFLPGLEDVQAPPGPQGWAEALDRLAFKPARRIILLALRAIAGTRGDCCPTNDAIRAQVAELGHTPPNDRGLTVLLRKLEAEDRLIARAADGRAKSRRRIRFAFLGQPSIEGAHDRHPWAHTIDTHGRTRSTPMGAHDVRPPSAQVETDQPIAPAPFSPLNSDSIQRGEETLTLRVREGTETPVPAADVDEPPSAEQVAAWEADLGRYPPGHPLHSFARLGLAIHRRALEESRLVAPASPAAPDRPVAVAQAPCPTPPARPSPARAPAPPPAPVETADLIRRLANPCGPEAVKAAAARLATRLGDEHSLGYYTLQCALVRDGKIPAKVLVGAFRRASSGTANCPGSVFNAFVREHGPPGSAQRPTPGARHHSSPGAGTERDASPCLNVHRSQSHVH